MRSWSGLLFAALVFSLTSGGCATVPKGMVRVPAGPFVMGTAQVDEDQDAVSLGLPEPWFADERPARTVTLPTFYIDRTEVTNRAYGTYIAAHPEASAPDDWSRRQVPPGKEDHPVAYVTWHHADHFCRWLEKRLPTEAEWEKAARGPDGLAYPWGNAFDRRKANVSKGPFDRGKTQPVGSHPDGASPYGALDMIGNVWEWVEDDYGPYPGNDTGVEAFHGGFKAMRGLSFEAVGHFPPPTYGEVVAKSARAAFRGYDQPAARLRDVGFRCAKDP
jgi:formylglycine-generating enzyme required for sulfatase activity